MAVMVVVQNRFEPKSMTQGSSSKINVLLIKNHARVKTRISIREGKFNQTGETGMGTGRENQKGWKAKAYAN